VVFTSTALTLAACGGGESDTAAERSDGQAGNCSETIRVSSSAIADYTPYWYADETGIFEEHGVKIEQVTLSGGSPGINALQGGSVDVVGGNSVSNIQATAQDLPIKVFAGVTANKTEGDDYYSVVVAKDSGITDAAGLKGKTLTTNVPGSINQIMQQAWLDSEGVDPGGVTFVSVPFPEQGQALLSGQAQGALMGPPYLQQIQDDLRLLAYPFQVVGEGKALPISSWSTSDDYAERCSDQLANFVAAMDEANEAVTDEANQDETYAIIEKRTGMSRDVIEKIVFPEFTTDPQPDGYERVAEVMAEQGAVAEAPSLDGLFLEDN
jgi:NitT/TauT family transport system substrate-binding protein